MTHLQFVISDTNPNDTMGGGGCICDERKQIDCKGPYAVFYGNDMESPLSPHVVICKPCADAVFKAMKGEALKSGEMGGAIPYAPPLPVPVASTPDEDEIIEAEAEEIDDEVPSV